jgi:hypothetical protein
MIARLSRDRIFVLDRGDRGAEQLLVRVPIQANEHAVLACGSNDVLQVRRPVQHRRGGQIVVHAIMRLELVIPAERASAGVERDYAVGVEIVAGAVLGVQVWRGISDRHQNLVARDVKGERRPSATAACQRRFLHLPSVRAGLVLGGDQVETPQLTPVLSVERHQAAAHPPIAAGRARVDEAVPCERRPRQELAKSRVPYLILPERLAGLCVDCDQRAVGQASKDASVAVSSATIDAPHVFVGRGIRVAPFLLAASRINRDRVASRRNVHRAVDDDRARMERSAVFDLDAADFLQRPHVLGGDLMQRRKPLGAIVVVVAWPIDLSAICRHDVGSQGMRRDKHAGSQHDAGRQYFASPGYGHDVSALIVLSALERHTLVSVLTR